MEIKVKIGIDLIKKQLRGKCTNRLLIFYKTEMKIMKINWHKKKEIKKVITHIIT